MNQLQSQNILVQYLVINKHTDKHFLAAQTDVRSHGHKQSVNINHLCQMAMVTWKVLE